MVITQNFENLNPIFLKKKLISYSTKVRQLNYLVMVVVGGIVVEDTFDASTCSLMVFVNSNSSAFSGLS